MAFPIAALIPILGDVLDKIIPDKEANAKAKAAMIELHQKGELEVFNRKADIIVAEAKSEHWLTATWRPIVMLTFAGLITARWFGWAAPGLGEAEVLHLWSIVELGLGGYVIGRSVEKVVPAIADTVKNSRKP